MKNSIPNFTRLKLSLYTCIWGSKNENWWVMLWHFFTLSLPRFSHDACSVFLWPVTGSKFVFVRVILSFRSHLSERARYAWPVTFLLGPGHVPGFGTIICLWIDKSRLSDSTSSLSLHSIAPHRRRSSRDKSSPNTPHRTAVLYLTAHLFMNSVIANYLSW